MFDLIVDGHRQSSGRDAGTLLMSLGIHSTVVALVVVVPLLYVTESFPQVPYMMAFVAAPPLPPPPPPPAPPDPGTPEPAVDVNPAAAPVEEPDEIEAEPVSITQVDRIEGAMDGVVAGTGSIDAPPPPPSPPPALEPAPAPVRIGGAIKQPALLTRVNPEYPLLALGARVEGIVILEAVVDREGRVEDVRILRSISMLDAAAIAAVRQWRYAPLLQHGKPMRFIVVVTLIFKLT